MYYITLFLSFFFFPSNFYWKEEKDNIIIIIIWHLKIIVLDQPNTSKTGLGS